jgi:Acyl-CoA dehydrogenases
VDFEFTEAQRMFQTTMRDFCIREIRPRYVEETRSRVRAGKALAEEVPRDLLKKVADMGCFAMGQPEKYGGQPGDAVSLGIAAEEIGREHHSLALSICGQKASLDALRFAAGGDEIKDELIPLLISGGKLGGFSLTEPATGSDAAKITAMAIRDGAYYVVNGEKTSQSYGLFFDLPVMFLRTDPASGARGITAFIMPMDLPGISKANLYHIGGQGMGAASIMFDNVRLPAKYRCGDEGQGFYLGMEIMDWQRTLLALMSLGAAEISWEETVGYVKQRNAFGRPIGKFEAVSFKLAEDLTKLETAKLLCYKALWLYDQGKKQETTIATAHAKWWTPRVATEVIHDCILLHGHVGFSTEYFLGRRLLDAMTWEIGDGTQEIMKTILVREVMGKDMVAYK